MRQKICILVSLGFIIILFSLSQVFGQKEEDVMKRYDYSSPKASFESYKKAIKEKDIEGVIIHGWTIGSRMNPMKFKDIVQYESKPEYKDKCFEESNRLWTKNGDLKITEVDFVKELEKEHIVDNPEKIPVTICKIIVERKNDGMQATVMAYNFDGTTEWWIFNYPGGE